LNLFESILTEISVPRLQHWFIEYWWWNWSKKKNFSQTNFIHFSISNLKGYKAWRKLFVKK